MFATLIWSFIGLELFSTAMRTRGFQKCNGKLQCANANYEPSEKVHLSWTNDGVELECLPVARSASMPGWMDGWLPGCETTMTGK